MPPGRRFGKYLLHEKLAVGGMGELYLATTAGAAKGTPPSVLKILLPEYSSDADFVSMFHDEAKIGMQLKHPNIVSVTDLGRVSDTPFIVLEYCHGENVKNSLRRVQDMGERFPPELAVRIAIEALEGLAHAHAAKDARGKLINLVHRDLSPDNIMVSFEGDVKLLDFGIAKSEGRATQTQFGILKGKAQYMAPEQAVGGEVDARTDLYALGLVLLEVITGQRRFSAEVDPVQQIRDARVWKAYGPSERDPTLPGELDTILLKALQPEPRRRWQSAEEFSQALRDLLRQGRLPQSEENLPRFMRRLFPGRAEPYLTEDPTEGGNDEPSVLTHSPPEIPKPLPVVRARASVAAPASEVFEDITNGRNDPQPDDEATQTGSPLMPSLASEAEAATMVGPRRAAASPVPRGPDERPTVPPAPRRPPPATPAPPAPRRLAGSPPLPEIPVTARARFQGAIEDPRGDDEEIFGDGTRAGEFGGGTNVAIPGLARRRASSASEDTHNSDTQSPDETGPAPARRRGESLDPPVKRGASLDPPVRRGATPDPPARRVDPSAHERGRNVRGRDPFAAPQPRRAGPSFLLLTVLVFALVLVASAAGALVFRDKLPPELQAHVISLADQPATPKATLQPARASPEPAPSGTVLAEATDKPEPVTPLTPLSTPAATPRRTVASAATPVPRASRPAPASTVAVAAATAAATATPAATAAETPEAPVATPSTVDLTTSSPAGTPASTAVAPAATPRVVRPAATPRPQPVAVSKDKAMVKIGSKPAGIEILVDGVGTGHKTPGTVQVDPGVHTLSLTADGFKPWSFQEELKAGDTLQLTADLVPN